jgi:hypothetical protein
VIVIDPRGISLLLEGSLPAAMGNCTITTMAELTQIGEREVDAWTARASEIQANSPCTVEVHLDRSVQPPTLRAHQATASEMLAAGDDLVQRLEAHSGDELYPIASFADPVERALSIALMLRVGAVLNIGEGGPLQRLEVRAVQPTIAHLPASQLRSIRNDVVQRQAKRGIRKVAVERLLNPSATGTRSTSSKLDRRITFGLLCALIAGAIGVHRLLIDQHGMIRIAIIAVLALAIGLVLVLGGFGVRPFVRRAYGLGAAHSLLTSPDLDAETRSFLGALHLAPIIEHRGTPTIASGSIVQHTTTQPES